MNRCDIAIIGRSGRLPGIKSLDELDSVFVNRKDCVFPFSEERRELLKLDKDVKYFDGAILDGVQYFDYEFFGISRQEAKNMDPQQKAVLELAYSAIEDAGYSADEMRGSSTSVIIGAHNSHLYDEYITDNSGVAFLGNFLDTAAGRVSYELDLHGEAAIVETACSSSLYAIYSSCLVLSAGAADMALAGGVSMDFRARLADHAQTDTLGLFSSGARCRTFDECADGINMGEGAGMVLLKRYEDAVRDRDPIYAVIKGASANQDGGRSNSLVAPSSRAQAEAIVTALKRAGVNAEDIGYIEAHGTGTKIGDPIEIQGITEAFSEFTDRKQFCPVGSLKTNFSHLGSAAGIASVLKCLASFENNRKYPLCRLDKINPLIDFAGSPVYPAAETEEWNPDRPRYMGISGFGSSGTNVHLVIGDCREKYYGKQEEKEYFVSVSADREDGVEKYCESLLKDIEKYPVGDIAYTLNKGRNDFRYRTSACVHSTEELKKFLEGSKKIYTAEKTEVVFTVSGDSSYTDDEILKLSENSRFFASEYSNLENEAGHKFSGDERNFAVTVSILRSFRKMGTVPFKIVAAGKGKYAADFFSGKITFADALEKVSISESSETDFSAFRKYMSKLSGEARCRLTVLEAGKEGRLGRCIEESEELCDTGVTYAVNAGCSLYAAFSVLYNAGVNTDWNSFYKDTEYARVHISTYPFAKSYSWPDIHHKKSESENEETTSIKMTAEEIRAAVRRAWEDELDTSDFTDDDSFFELGANSVSAMDVTDIIAEETGAELNFADMYQYTSVNSLTEYICSKAGEQEESEETALSDGNVISYNQKRMLYLADNTAGSAVYNMPVFHVITGKFDPGIFIKSMKMIVDRHDILHTIYRRNGDDYCQKVLSEYDFCCEYRDMTGQSDEKIMNFIEDYSFDINLYSEIPLKSVIVKSGEERYFWAVNLHHIAGDGYSYGVFASEIMNIYDGLAKDSSYSPEPLRCQYTDYIRSEQRFLSGKRAAQQREFWNNELEGVSGILRFPSDKERPSHVTYNGDLYEFTVPEEVFSRASEFALENELTPFMLFESVWALTLAGYTSEDDICIGTPFANRNSQEFRELIGFFVNTLVIRNRINRDLTVREYLKSSADSFKKVYSNAELPFEEAISGTKFKRSSSYLPLIQFMFAYQNFRTGNICNDSFSMAASELKTYTSKFEMTVTLAEQGSSLSGSVEYNTDLYCEDTVSKLIKDFIGMVEASVQNPDRTVGSICSSL